MVSLIGDGSKYFSIFTRKDPNNSTASCLYVPQKIFPHSKIIDKIKSNKLSNGSTLYINRDEADMKEVVNFLSGHSYDKSKEGLIHEILEQDLEIKFESDHDHKQRLIDFDKKRNDIIVKLWKSFKSESGFYAEKQPQHSYNSDSSSKCHIKQIELVMFDQGWKLYIDEEECIIDDYQEICMMHSIDFLEIIHNKIIEEYPFLNVKIDTTNDGKKCYDIRLYSRDISKLNKVIHRIRTSEHSKYVFISLL